MHKLLQKNATLFHSVWIAGVFALMSAVQASASNENSAQQWVSGIEIRRTTDGIPHLRANNWYELGFGIGYVQAQDALCTLAEAFVTYEGRRAWFFGAEAQPVHDSTFGRSKNLDLDFFFRAFADEEMVAQLRAEQPSELNEVLNGFAIGYNRYLGEARRGQHEYSKQRACLNEAWVREISTGDLYRRIYTAQIAAGYSRFISEIVNAKPAALKVADADGTAALRDKLTKRIGEQSGLGSNVLAFGHQVTGEEEAVLFGNPHWYWGGPDRFYQMHLTIPNRLDVAGVAFLGIPVIMIGFNEHIAWSHTVSAARRFGLFDLTLDPADPTRYQVDGKTESMQAREVSVEVRDEKGGGRYTTKTLYSTRFGPILDLGRKATAFGWGTAHALAIRDVNAKNLHIFRNFFYWNQAKSLDEFIAIQRREAAVPWVNTVAIGRGDGRVWYGDIGAAPNVPDTLRKTCTTPLTKSFASLDALTPFLDGSRSDCDWHQDEEAVQPGAMPARAMPGLLREDYVANMNDSYWLTNVHQPLEGFPSVLGGERQPLSLRGRLGHRIALELSQGAPHSARTLSQRLMQAVLTPRAYSAELFKDELLVQACAHPTVEVPTEGAVHNTEADSSVRKKVEVTRACEILQHWANKADADDRGVRLWETFWAHLSKTSDNSLYRVGFSHKIPLETPRELITGGKAAQALATAVASLVTQGVTLDAPLSSERFVESGGRQLPLYGGCHSAGYFTIACNREGSERLGSNSLANSYLQVVHFGPGGVEAHTLLAHGEDESAVENGHGSAPVERYSRKDWLHFPFYEKDIARDPELARMLLQP